MNEENIQEHYYTAEIERQIREMSEEEMFRTLGNLEETPFWIAILKYNALRTLYSQSALNSGDPFKDPTSIARNQGVMLGISDLQNAIISIVMDKREAKKQSELKDKE